MSPTTTPTTTIQSRAVAALARAQAAKLVAYKVAPNVYDVPSVSEPSVLHRCVFHGPRWYDWSCDCKAAGHDVCLHRVTAAYAKKYKVHAVRPATMEPAAAVAEAQAIVAQPLGVVWAKAYCFPCRHIWDVTPTQTVCPLCGE